MRIFGGEPAGSARPEGAKTPVSRALTVSSNRIGEIVSAATQAVADIRSEADALRRSGSAESKISRERLVVALADSLVVRAEELKRDAANLADILDRAAERLDTSTPAASELAPNGQMATDDRFVHEETEVAAMSDPGALRPRKRRGARSHLQEKVADRFDSSSEPAPATGRRTAFKRRSSASSPPIQSTPSPDGLRLLATQMAVAGSGRDEIEARLCKDFGVDDASTLLGDIGTGRVESKGRSGE
jgi:hypothetical protein